jgi:hypothetical protein
MIGVVLSLVSLLKTVSLRVAGRSIGAAIFWGVSFAVLYVPEFGGTSLVAQQAAMLGPRLASFVLLFESVGPLTEIWIGSIIANLTIRYTKTRSYLATEIRNILDGLSYGGAALLLFAFLSGAIP